MNFEEFKIKFNISLNPQQEAAIQNIEQPTLLLAVPGSGKTTTLVCRIGYMIYVCGIDPSKILVLTFTRAAAEDMKKRFVSIFGAEHAKALRFRTINGICNAIIVDYHKTMMLQIPKLITDNTPILRRIYQMVYEDFPADNEIQEIQLAITRAKNLRMTTEEIKRTKIGKASLHPVYVVYEKMLRENGCMDYDDQLCFAYKYLSTDSEYLARIRKLFPYTLVDEAQDTSKIQHEIVALLAKATGSLFMVGDEDQSIYGFRAAYPDALINFSSDYENARILRLERNYRSKPEIVKVSDLFIRQNSKRFEKNMFTKLESGGKVSFSVSTKREDQYAAIVDKLLPSLKGETAILFRNNDSALPLMAELTAKNMPFRCRNIDNMFFSSRVVRDMRNLLQSALDPFDESLIWETYSVFDSHISKKALTDAIHEPEPDRYNSLWDQLRHEGSLNRATKAEVEIISDTLKEIRKDISVRFAIDMLCKAGYSRRDEDQVFILSALADEDEKVAEFLDRLADIESRVKTSASVGFAGNDAPIVLSTIHSSKGLEYDNVIIMDEISPVFPAFRSEIEEERRLFYVAMTRAKNNLIMMRYDDAKQPFIDWLIKLNARAKKVKTLGVATNHATHASAGLAGAKSSRRGMTVPTAERSRHIVKNADDLHIGAVVSHSKFGDGKVISMKDGLVSIRFLQEKAVKQFMVSICIETESLSILY